MSVPYVIERLSPLHDRTSFSCGVEALDRYFVRHAGQDARRGVANCFVAVLRETGAVAGYYTLSATGISTKAFPDEIVRRLPQYPTIPAALIGRLAVHSAFRGMGLGEALIMDAADRARASDPAVFAVVVEAKDETAAAFYRHYEFRPLSNLPMTLFLPVASFKSRSTSKR